MRAKVIVLLIGALFIFGANIGRCQDPGVPDTIRIDYIPDQIGPNTQLVAEMTIYNDDTLGALAVPLTFDEVDITCDSVSFVGGRADYIAYFKDGVIDWSGFPYTVVIGVIPIFADSNWMENLDSAELAHPMYPGETRDLLCNIYFTTGPTWDSSKELVLDTFYSPSPEFFGPPMWLQFVLQSTATSFVPVFVNHHEDRVAKVLGVNEVPGTSIPEEFSLSQNYPNPFNPETNIRFSVDEKSNVTLTVYNVLGQKVKTVVNERLQAGVYETSWNSTNENGQRVASGMYFYRIVAGEDIATKKMMLLR